jgi:hypothetical protein
VFFTNRYLQEIAVTEKSKALVSTENKSLFEILYRVWIEALWRNNYMTSGNRMLCLMGATSLNSTHKIQIFDIALLHEDRLCGLVVRVLGYRSGGSGSIPGATRFSERKKKEKGKQVVGLERGQLSLVSTTEVLLDRNVAAPV